MYPLVLVSRRSVNIISCLGKQLVLFSVVPYAVRTLSILYLKKSEPRSSSNTYLYIFIFFLQLTLWTFIGHTNSNQPFSCFPSIQVQVFLMKRMFSIAADLLDRHHRGTLLEESCSPARMTNRWRSFSLATLLRSSSPSSPETWSRAVCWPQQNMDYFALV